MKILFVTHYFPPEIGAPQRIFSDWVPRVVELGHQVTVLTGLPNYPSGIVAPDYRGSIVKREEMYGAEIVRTYMHSGAFSRRGRRLLNLISFTASGWLGLPFLGRPDVVVSQFPPIFPGLTGLGLSRLLGAVHVLKLDDLWVEGFSEMGLVGSLSKNTLMAGCKALMRGSQRVVTTTAGAAAVVEGYGIPRHRLASVPNSVDIDKFTPQSTRRSEIRKRMGWENRTVVLYHGNHGYSQSLWHLLEAADQLQEEKDIHFAFAGEGAERGALEQKAAALGLSNVEFYGQMPSEDMPGLVDACDLGLVPLADIASFRYTSPSKLMEFMAMERPVLLGIRGDALDMVQAANGGLGYKPEDGTALAQAIATLDQDARRRKQMGQSARRWAIEHLSRDLFVNRWDRILREAINERPGRRVENAEDSRSA